MQCRACDSGALLPRDNVLPRLVRCLCGFLDECAVVFLEDFVTMDSQDVVDTTDPQTLSEEGELHLRVVAELNALVRCADDICLAQELVRDKLPRPNSDSERDAAVGGCRGSGQAPHVANSPGGAASRSFTEWTTFVFSWFRSAPTLALATSKSWKKGNTKIG